MHSAHADLKEVKPVSGFVKGQAARVVQPSKPSAALTPVNKSAVSTESEGPGQPLQQVQQSAPTGFDKNSLAIKLSNNPLATLAGLQEAVGTVLDEPVSTVFQLEAMDLFIATVDTSIPLAQFEPFLFPTPPKHAMQGNSHIV